MSEENVRVLFNILLFFFFLYFKLLFSIVWHMLEHFYCQKSEKISNEGEKRFNISQEIQEGKFIALNFK